MEFMILGCIWYTIQVLWYWYGGCSYALLYRGEEGLDQAWQSMAQNCTHLQRLCLDKGLCSGSPPTSATWWNRSKRFVIRVLYLCDQSTSSLWSKHVPNRQTLGKGRLLVNLTFRELNSAFPKWRNTKMWKKLYTKKKKKKSFVAMPPAAKLIKIQTSW